VDLALWQFAERTHPVYERPAEATRWPFARPVPYAATEGVEPAEYEEGEEGLVSEPLQMSLEAVPSAGVVLTFWNERKSERGAPVAWFLAHGSVKMQAHGPWETVPRWFWPRLVTAWRAEARRASMRQRALEGQFGTAGVD